MKILNLYAGVGGNRILWGDDVEVTAVEFDKEIARAYKDRFPNDNVVVADVKEYLLQHYKEFDFIWANPPCQSHSRIIFSQYKRDVYKPKLPDMSLYQIIIFLQLHFKDKLWVVENVKPYYEPLIKPTIELGRHLFWSNFEITYKEFKDTRKIRKITYKDSGIDLSKYKIKDKRQVIRNMVDENIAKYILDITKENKWIGIK